MKSIEKIECLKKLQKEILDLQGFCVPPPGKNIALGSMNTAFPNGAFPVSAVHEFISSTKEGSAATAGFMTALLGLLPDKGFCLWVSANRLIFPPALKTFGMAPDQVIFVNTTNKKHRLWTIEEGLKCNALTAVVGEIDDLTFAESRRLQLAVESSHVTGFIHRHGVNLNTVTCVSRWNIKSLPGEVGEMPGIGFPRWEATLLKIRNGRPGKWNVIWMDGELKVNDPHSKGMVLPLTKTG